MITFVFRDFLKFPTVGLLFKVFTRQFYLFCKASQVQYIPKLCKHSWDPNHVCSKLMTCFKEGLMMTL